jgi:hypothetical protein
VGICAGATTYIRAFPCVKAVDGLKGHAEPRVLLLPHPANPLANEPGSTYEMRMYYANGPGMSFQRGWYTIKYYIDRRWHTVRAYCDVRGVAKYLEKVKGWAYVVGRWIVDGVEKGRFAIMSVHPEIMGRRDRDPDMVKMFVYALLWAAKRLPADWILTVSPGPTVTVPKPGKDRRVTLTATLTNWVNEPISGFPVEVTIEGPTGDRSLQLTTNEQGMVSVTVPVTREGEYRVRFRAVDASATVEIVAGRRERQPSPAAGLPILLALATLLRARQRSQRHLHQPTGHAVQHGRGDRVGVPDVAPRGHQQVIIRRPQLPELLGHGPRGLPQPHHLHLLAPVPEDPAGADRGRPHLAARARQPGRDGRGAAARDRDHHSVRLPLLHQALRGLLPHELRNGDDVLVRVSAAQPRAELGLVLAHAGPVP